MLFQTLESGAESVTSYPVEIYYAVPLSQSQHLKGLIMAESVTSYPVEIYYAVPDTRIRG